MGGGINYQNSVWQKKDNSYIVSYFSFTINKYINDSNFETIHNFFRQF